MKITFLGAAGTVTGSKYLLDDAGTKILIDCGMFQGLKALRLKNWDELSFDPATVDAVVLTHAHIDHSGYLPVLYKKGYRGPVICTPATRELCKILLTDAGRIQEEDTAYANRKGFSKHKPALPLFTEEDALKVLELFTTHPANKPFKIKNTTLEFYGAGHILGAASVLVTDEGSSVLFSGDLGRQHDLIMCPPTPPPSADWIVMESTYGDRLHSSDDPFLGLTQVIQENSKKGGVLVVPTFAVGRAQSLLYALFQLKQKKLIGDVPVFLDSPMATDATELYLRYHSEHRLSQELAEAVCRSARFITSPKESMELMNVQRPAIILSASGMITGGRVLHHVAHFGPDSRNTILIVGYQAPGTRGADLVEGARSLKIHGQYVAINASVKILDSFSAHADQKELLGWLALANKNARGVILVHGEPVSMDKLRMKIEETTQLPVFVPEAGQTLQIR